jgi:hypothetical protein
MRDILFRGIVNNDLLINHNQWVYGGLDLYKDRYKENYAAIFNADGFYTVNPKTVGEYTGMRDKNDIAIYEGDILKVQTSRGEVSEENPPVYIIKLVEYKKPYFTGFIYDKAEYKSEYHEVIGNIHDNPELLEGVK